MRQTQCANESPAIAGERALTDRVLSCGVHSLTHPELIELVIGSIEGGHEARYAAEKMLRTGDGLRSLAAARVEELVSASGVSVARATAVAAAFQLGRLAAAEPRPTRIRRADDVAAIARREFAGVRQECVLVVVCDAANRVLRNVVVSEGAIDRSLVPVREILNAVLRHDGRAFAIAHNHPYGDVEPSRADQRATNEVEDASSVVGLRFLGHVVVGDDHANTAISQWPPNA
jgi:DNA repair protein RadC